MAIRSKLGSIYFVIFAALVLVLGGIFILDHKNHNAASSSHQLKVVAAENFWGNIASQIGGNKISVISIISDPNTDPHLYESDAHAAASVTAANLVIKNGLGYDAFIDKLLSASPNRQRQVISVGDIQHSMGNDPNPHVWYDIPGIPLVADAITQALSAQDPSDSATFDANLVLFKNSLKPILDTLNQIKNKYAAVPVAYTERVPGYLLLTAGLNIKTPAGFAAAIEQGNDPSPNDAAAMESLITNHTVRVLLYNAQTTNSVTQHIRDLANQFHIPVIGVTETLPTNEPSYQLWQLNQTKALLQALGG